MDSRMSKYSPTEKTTSSRVKRNESIYQNINKNNLDNFDISNNATILENNYKNEIDVEKLKKILDTKYNETPKRKSIRIEEEPQLYLETEETTKEYDLNAILNKARIENVVDYETQRAKKVNNTQLDILKDLQINQNEFIDQEENPQDLLNLINTIAVNEKKSKKIEDTDSTADLFKSLKGSNLTEKYDGLHDNITTKQEKLEQTFFSKSTQFDKKDFTDLEPETEKEKGKFFTQILVIITLVAFVTGIFIFLKSILSF